MSFVFYDVETTGLSPFFDQIVQFAAIKVDHQLNEVDRFEIRSRLNEHAIPHPDALRVNGLGIEDLLDRALPSHYEMVCRIRQRLQDWGQGIYAGYNSISFDEEFLRQALYQCLFNPYLTSQRGCGRADVLNLALDAASSSPGSLIIPNNSDGRPSFKLADICRANGLGFDRMHDALADVRATVELCKRLRTRARDAWERFVRFSSKAATADFIQGENAFLLTRFRGNRAYHYPLVWVANDRSQAALAICLVVDKKTRRLINATDSELDFELTQNPSMLVRVRTNKAPAITPIWDIEESLLGEGLTADEVEEIGGAVRGDTAFCSRIEALHQRSAPNWPASEHLEQRIYDGFWSREDESLMAKFHEADWAERAALVAKISDGRSRALGLRLVYFQSPHLLSPAQAANVKLDLRKRSPNGTTPLGVERAIELVDELLLSISGEEADRLVSYRAYLDERRAGLQLGL